MGISMAGSQMHSLVTKGCCKDSPMLPEDLLDSTLAMPQTPIRFQTMDSDKHSPMLPKDSLDSSATSTSIPSNMEPSTPTCLDSSKPLPTSSRLTISLRAYLTPEILEALGARTS